MVIETYPKVRHKHVIYLRSLKFELDFLKFGVSGYYLVQQIPDFHCNSSIFFRKSG
mgnify:CR=1 FL=1